MWVHICKCVRVGQWRVLIEEGWDCGRSREPGDRIYVHLLQDMSAFFLALCPRLGAASLTGVLDRFKFERAEMAEDHCIKSFVPNIVYAQQMCTHVGRAKMD